MAQVWDFIRDSDVCQSLPGTDGDTAREVLSGSLAKRDTHSRAGGPTDGASFGKQFLLGFIRSFPPCFPDSFITWLLLPLVLKA